MPRLRTSVVFAVIAASLLAFILIFERGTPSSGELERRKDSALPGFVRDRVSKLEIQHAGKLTVLTRQVADDDAEPSWQVEAPYRAKADREAVDGLLSELEFLNPRRRLENISAADRAQFGFESPRFRVWFTLGGTRTRLLVGKASPRGDGVYVEGTVAGTALIVDEKITHTLAQEPTAYHAKELLGDVRSGDATQLSVRDEHGERAVRRDGSRWLLSTPALGLASEPAINDLLGALDGLRAKHFVAQSVSAADAAGYGLSVPRIKVAVRQRAGAAYGKPSNAPESSAELQIGAACPGYPGESYASANGSVMCVADADIAKLHPGVLELRERRLLPIDNADEIGAVQVERGDTRLQLRKGKADAGWSYELTRAGTTLLQGVARADAVRAWFDALKASQALRFEPAQAAASPAQEHTSLRVTLAEGKAEYALDVEPTSEGALALRAGESERAVLPASAIELLAPSAARFRALSLAHVPESALKELEIRRGNVLERIGRSADGKQFSVSAPVHAPLDAARFGELTRKLADLEAVRFVADTASPSHGLANPSAQLGVDYETDGKDAPRQHLGLRLGGATDGGRFAQLEGQAGVFVLPEQFAELLWQPLVSRTALSVPLETIEAVELESRGKSVRVERQGEAFVAHGAAIEPGRVRVFVETLATLRASALTEYGPAQKAQGLQPAFARIVVSLKAAGAPLSRVELTLGAETPLGRHARRADLALGFIIPPSASEALVSLLPAR